MTSAFNLCVARLNYSLFQMPRWPPLRASLLLPSVPPVISALPVTLVTWLLPTIIRIGWSILTLTLGVLYDFFSIIKNFGCKVIIIFRFANRLMENLQKKFSFGLRHTLLDIRARERSPCEKRAEVDSARFAWLS